MSEGDILRAGVDQLIAKADSMFIVLPLLLTTVDDMNIIALTLGLEQSLNPNISRVVNVHKIMEDKLTELSTTVATYVSELSKYRGNLSS